MNSERKNCQCRVLRLGRLEYGAAYSVQENLVDKRIKREIEDTLICLEHEPVFTIGRGGSSENILITEEERIRENIGLWEINRGGAVTYHGPGQLVVYPIFDLNCYGRDAHRFIRLLEEVTIRTLTEYEIDACRIQGLTGVWVDQKKVASIGIGVRKWVSFHGLSLNVAPDMKHFSYIDPCGLGKEKMTSMKELLRKNISIDEVMEKLIHHFCEVFGLTV